MAATLTAVPKAEQQSVIRFLRLENVLGSEIHARMYICCVRLYHGVE